MLHARGGEKGWEEGRGKREEGKRKEGRGKREKGGKEERRKRKEAGWGLEMEQEWDEQGERRAGCG